MYHEVFLKRSKLVAFIVSILFFDYGHCDPSPLEQSDYVTIIITVPETHADAVREALGRAGAGKVGDYSYCSWSVKGVGRFMPDKNANPHIGKEGIIEEVVEERIETVCNRSILEHVLEEIKKAHPYEETVIDIYPVYKIGHKTAIKDPQP